MKKNKLFLLVLLFFAIGFIYTENINAEKNVDELYCVYDGHFFSWEKDGQKYQIHRTYMRIDSDKSNGSYAIYAEITFSTGQKKIQYNSHSTIDFNKLRLQEGDYANLTTCPKVAYSRTEQNIQDGTVSLVVFPTTESAKGHNAISAFYHTYNGVEYSGTCLIYDNETDCKGAIATGQACVWNKTKYGDYCNVDKNVYIKCGDAKDIPHQVPQIVSFAINFLKILTPLILIFISIISLLKAISAGNEDEIKKAQKGLIRKIIAAVMVFFIIYIVQFVIMKVADNETKSDVNDKVETTNLSDCLNCFLNNKCGDSAYYKTYIGSQLTETFLSEK